MFGSGFAICIYFECFTPKLYSGLDFFIFTFTRKVLTKLMHNSLPFLRSKPRAPACRSCQWGRCSACSGSSLATYPCTCQQRTSRNNKINKRFLLTLFHFIISRRWRQELLELRGSGCQAVGGPALGVPAHTVRIWS